MADELFEHARLAAVYDTVEGVRSDLDAYVAIAEELGARRVLDVGCGTGTFAVLLADRGFAVTGVDPTRASLDVARAKRGAERVRWIHGDARTLPPLEVDLATMTGTSLRRSSTNRNGRRRCAPSAGCWAATATSSSRRATRRSRRGGSGTATRLTA